MSSMDFSDPQIWIAYDALLRNAPTRWLLLEYGYGPHVLVLSASGTGDVNELRTHLKDNICYAIFREQTQDNKPLCISINYIPNSVRGVWRARALVHVTAIASKFKVHEVLSISASDQLSVRALRSTLNLPPRVLRSSGPEEPSSINSVSRKPPPDINSIAKKPPSGTNPVSGTSSPPIRSSSLAYGSHFRSSLQPLASPLPMEIKNSTQATDIDIPFPAAKAPLPSITPSRMGSLLANISTAGSSSPSKSSNQPQSLPAISPASNRSSSESRVSHPTHSSRSSRKASWLAKQEAPLPLPPDSNIENRLEDAERSSIDSDGQPVPSQVGSIPDSNSVASLHSIGPVASPPPSAILSQSVDSGSAPTGHIKEAPRRHIDGLPPPSLTSLPKSQPNASNPATSENVADRPTMNQAAVVNPRSFSAPMRQVSRFQERASSPAETEEERKLAVLEEERRRRAAERAKREKEFREEEEARQKEFAERKKRDKQRRLENARKSEDRRVELKRQQDEQEALKKAEKERKDAEVRERRNSIKKRFDGQTGVDLLSGFVTLESSSSWKRRYYRLSTEYWTFFKNDEDTTAPIHTLELSRIQALREWNEGYEELEAISNSFAVEFKNDVSYLFFADSAEDKEILLGFLNQAAGL